MVLISIEDLSVGFSGVKALNRISLNIKKGEIHGIIGPNGAGKTTLLNAISRFVQPINGKITYDGINLLSKRAHQLAKMGIGRTFQDARIIPTMSVLDNILIGLHSQKSGFSNSLFALVGSRKRENSHIKKAFAVLELIRKSRIEASVDNPLTINNLEKIASEFPDLIDFESHPASILPQGPRKMLDIGRAIASEPKILLLDEPAAGAQQEDIDQLVHLILAIRDKFNTTIIMVEHHMSLVMKVCDQITVLDFGEKIAEGNPAEIQKNQRVIDSYLGRSADSGQRFEASNESIKRPQRTIDNTNIIELKHVDVYYGKVKAIDHVSLALKRKSITAFVGSNGAGKSTLLKAMSGLQSISSGSILFEGGCIVGNKIKFAPHKIVKMGISQVLEGKQVFGDMSVKNNLIVGGNAAPQDIQKNLEKVFRYFPVLKVKATNQASTLSGGEQQMLAIGQALMSNPKVLLLDEPSLGLAPTIIDRLFDIIQLINLNEAVSIGLVEQNAYQALRISDYAYIFETGKIVAEGVAADLLKSEVIRNSYLGTQA